MKRMFSTLLVIAVVALSAVSVASARHWDGDEGPAVTQQFSQQLAPAKHHKKASAKKLDKNPYAAPNVYLGPH